MIQLLVPAIAGLLDKVIPDKDQRDQLAHEIGTLTERQAHEIAQAQIKVNEAEAQHHSIFVSGARPFLLWICAFGLGINYILYPLSRMVAGFAGFELDLEPLDLSTMMPVLLGMLGLGTMRTYEKKHGVARNSL